MSRVVLAGAAGVGVPRRTVSLVHPGASAPRIAVVTQPPQQQQQQQHTPTHNHPAPTGARNLAAAPHPSFTPWSDHRAATFLLNRLDRAMHAYYDPTHSPSDSPPRQPAPAQFWEYFLMLKDAKAEIGPETCNALLSIMARIGSVDQAARTVANMGDAGVHVTPESGSDLVAAYARGGQYHLAMETLKHFAAEAGADAEQGAPGDHVTATFLKLETPAHASHNKFARALLENMPRAGLGEAEREHFISVAKGSTGGGDAWQVLNRMKRAGRGDIDGGDAMGSLAWACGTGRDVDGAQKTVTLAEAKDTTSTPCYEGLALAYKSRLDVDGSSETLDRFSASGHSMDSASFLLETVAQTATPHALKGDKKAKDVCKRVYETTLQSNVDRKERIANLLKQIVFQ